MTRPGLARERTTVAWGRTALGAAGLGGALLRLGALNGSAAELAGGALALLSAVLLALAGRAVYRDRPGRARILEVRLVALGIATAGMLTALAILI